MAAELSATQVEFLREKHIAHVVTLLHDGSPHVTPIWVDTDGKVVLINTARGRVKERNLARDPRVAISIADESDIYRWLAVRGRAQLVDEGATELINALNQKYTGNPDYPLPLGEKRVTVRIIPERISGTVL
jgi:PPOX class probable F420-dependent enzyme